MMTTAIAIGSLGAQPGTRVTGLVPVDVGDGNRRGAGRHRPRLAPGPRVAVTAGIHGAEYVSIAALREVVLDLDPATVTGSLVAVLTASPPLSPLARSTSTRSTGSTSTASSRAIATDRRPSASPTG